MNVYHLTVTKSVAHFQIKRFKHNDYVRTYNIEALTNVVNRNISVKFYQNCLSIFIWLFMTADLTNCSSALFNIAKIAQTLLLHDKRYLIADLPESRANPHTHGYGQRDLATIKHIVANWPKPRAQLPIRHRSKRFVRKHALFTRRFELVGVLINKEAARWWGRQQVSWWLFSMFNGNKFNGRANGRFATRWRYSNKLRQWAYYSTTNLNN